MDEGQYRVEQVKLLRRDSWIKIVVSALTFGSLIGGVVNWKSSNERYNETEISIYLGNQIEKINSDLGIILDRTCESDKKYFALLNLKLNLTQVEKFRKDHEIIKMTYDLFIETARNELEFYSTNIEDELEMKFRTELFEALLIHNGPESDFSNLKLNDLNNLNRVASLNNLRKCIDCDFSRSNLSNTDLRNKDFSSSSFHKTNFYKSNLSSSNLFKVKGTRADFSSSTLNYTKLNSSVLSGSDFLNANGTYTDFTLAILDSTNFRPQKFIAPIIWGMDLTDAILKSSAIVNHEGTYIKFQSDRMDDRDSISFSVDILFSKGKPFILFYK